MSEIKIKKQEQGSDRDREKEQVLKQCWDVVNEESSDEYISQGKLVQWVNRVFSQQKQQQFLQRLDLSDRVSAYIKQIHDLDPSSISNVMFKYDEAVEFYNWIIQAENKEEEQSEDKDNEGKSDEGNEKQEGNSPKNSKVEQKQEPHEEQPKQQEQEQKQKYLYPAKKDEVGNEDNNDENNEDQGQEEDEEDPNQFNEFSQKIKNQEGNDHQDSISKNYKQLLLIVFDHYCRISYATGNDPTFEQIQHKTQVMTINKFMIFSKQFGVLKLNSMSRPWLIETFKKNSEYHKEMNFDQFVQVLLKISQVVYGADNKDPIQETSKEFQQLLLFLQVNNFTVFKKKMNTMGISYRLKGSTSVKKTVPNNYQFKYAPSNGRTKEEIRQEVNQRKRIRSENKALIRNAVKSTSVLQKREPLKKSTNKEEINLREKRNIIGRPQLYSQQEKPMKADARNLIPPTPPPKRSIPPKQAEPVVTGYANIHRMKMKQGSKDSRLKLNHIVEDARRIVETEKDERLNTEAYGREYNFQTGRQTPKTDMPDYYGQKSNPFEPPSRDNTYSDYGNYSERESVMVKINKYDPFSYNPLSKKEKAQGNPDLHGLLDDDGEDDEFLAEHLNRERKNDLITQRIAKKIRQIENT